jgi:O-antigen ligase
LLLQTIVYLLLRRIITFTVLAYLLSDKLAETLFMLSKKQLNYIKKEYPHKTVEQIAAELGLSQSQVFQTLNLSRELWALRIDNTIRTLAILLLGIAPLIFIRGLHDFADLPQRAFIQAVAVVLMLLRAASVLLKGEMQIPKTPVHIMIFAFVGWSLLSILWAHNRYEGFYSTIHLISCAIIVFVISTTLFSSAWISRIRISIFAAATCVALLGLMQQFFQIKWIPMSVSPAATFGNPNMAADYLAIILPLIIAAGIFQQRILLRCIAWVIVLLSVLFLFYTNCRGAWLAVVCAILYMGISSTFMKLPEKVLVRSLIAGSVLSIGIILLIFFSAPGKELQQAAFSEYRLIPWKNGLYMAVEKPLHGFGAGNFKVFYPRYNHKAAIDPAFDINKIVGKVHNDYIQTAVELGLPGIILFIMLPAYGLMATWRLCTARPGSDYFKPLVTGLSGGLIAFMVVAFFSFPMERSMPPLLLFMYLGILVMLYNQPGCSGTNWVIKVPQLAGAALFTLLFIGGVSLIRFNYNNLNCDGYYFKTMGMERTGQARSALSEGLKAWKLNAYRMDIMTAVGRAYAATGELDNAVITLEGVLEKYPFNLNALFFMGAAYANADENERALKTFMQILQIKPDFPDAKKIVFSIKAYGKIRVNLM